MTETVMLTKAFPEVVSEHISTERVRVKKIDDTIHLVPVKEKVEYEVELCGILADCPELSSYRHSEDKQLEKELEL
jgi:hypothetical protein